MSKGWQTFSTGHRCLGPFFSSSLSPAIGILKLIVGNEAIYFGVNEVKL